MNEHLSNSCSSRLEWIDLLKGIAIFCVVLGHMSYTAETEHVKNLIYSFHMPMFFLLAGLTSGMSFYRSKSILAFVKKRIVSVLLPYIVWSLLYGTLFTDSIAELTSYNWKEHCYTLLWGTVYNWFLICLFLLQLYLALYGLLTKRTDNDLLKFFAAIGVFIIAVCAHKLYGKTSHESYKPVLYFTTAYSYFIPFSVGVALTSSSRFFNFFFKNEWFICFCVCILIFAAGLWKSIPYFSYYPKVIIGICVSCVLIRLSYAYTPPSLIQFGAGENLSALLLIIRQIFIVFGKYSLGIYLLHGLFMPGKFIESHSPAYTIVCYCICCIPVCLCCIILKKIICTSRFLALLLFGKVISTNRFQNNVASHIN